MAEFLDFGKEVLKSPLKTLSEKESYNFLVIYNDLREKPENRTNRRGGI